MLLFPIVEYYVEKKAVGSQILVQTLLLTGSQELVKLLCLRSRDVSILVGPKADQILPKTTGMRHSRGSRGANV